MTGDPVDGAGPGSDPPPWRRRPRYSGRHPRRFDEKYKELDPARFPEMQVHVRAQGRTPAGTHVPVMVETVMEALRPAPGDIVIDCTIGYGGHAAEFLRRIAPGGRLVGLDVDGPQLERVRARFACAGASVSLHRSNFAGLPKVLAAEGLAACDVIFTDLGVSSMQIDDSARGFSYKVDGPLDMRMDSRRALTAADWLGRLSRDELAEAFRDLADEPDADAIAQEIVDRRAAAPLTRTAELARLVRQVKKRRGRIASAGESAARVFQAIRMIVNDERGALSEFLRVAPDCLAPGGRLGVISFHSGEDRRVARAIREGLARGVFVDASVEPIRPDARERYDNPRSASALFRWARRGA